MTVGGSQPIAKTAAGKAGDKRSPRLLLLASKLGYQTRSFAEAARRVGAEVRIASDRCHKLDDPWSDGAIPLHFQQPEQAAERLVEFLGEALGAPGAGGVDAILALGDRQTATAAYAARALGLRYNSPGSVKRCRSKLRQRQTLRAAGLPVPDFFAFALNGRRPLDQALNRALDGAIDRAVARATFPCVLKPLRLAASQGVIRANDAAEFRAAAARIRRLLESPELRVTHEPELDQILVERYIPGAAGLPVQEVALEGVLEDGRLRVLALFDKPDPLEGPYFEESIYATPSRLDAAMQEGIFECAAQTARALGLTEGPLHAEFRVNEAGPWVLEAAPRPIGGLCARVLRFGAERMPLEELLVRQALARQRQPQQEQEPVRTQPSHQLREADYQREPQAAGVMMIPVPQSGTLEAVEGLDEAAATPLVEQIEITARVHDFIAAWPEGSSYLGFIFARGEEPAGVEAALRRAHGALRFRIAPRLAVEHPAEKLARQSQPSKSAISGQDSISGETD